MFFNMTWFCLGLTFRLLLSRSCLFTCKSVSKLSNFHIRFTGMEKSRQMYLALKNFDILAFEDAVFEMGEELIWTNQGRVEYDVLGCESRKGCSDSLVHLFLSFLSPSFLCRRLSFPAKRFYTSLLTPLSSMSFNSSIPHRDALI